MADDTPTVETVEDARKRVEYVLEEYLDGLWDEPSVRSAIDALIAAVRAENAAEMQQLRLRETAIMLRYGAR